MPKEIAKSEVLKKYCIDCKKIVEVDVYNGECTPPLVICKDCGQFCHEEDQPKVSEISESEVVEYS